MNSRILMTVRRILTIVRHHRTDRIELRKMSKNYHESKHNTIGKIQTTLVISLVGWWPLKQLTPKEKESYEDAFKEKWEIISKYLYNDLWPTLSPALKKLLIKAVLSMMMGVPVDSVIGPIMQKFYDYICDYLSTMDPKKADLLSTERLLHHLYKIGKIYYFADETVRAALALLLVKCFGHVTPNVDTEKNPDNSIEIIQPTLQDLEQQLKNDLDQFKCKYDIHEESQQEQ